MPLKKQTLVNKAPAAPSCFNGSASTYKSQLADAVFEQNGEFLRAKESD